MKRFIAAVLAFILVLSLIGSTSATDIPSNDVRIGNIDNPTATSEATEPPVEEEYPPEEHEPPPAGIEEYDYTIDLSNLFKYSIVALNNATLNGHTRGSIWVGGELTGGEWKFVDDGSLGGNSPSDSYVAVNKSHIQFKGRTSQQSETAYKGLTANAVSTTKGYWNNLI